MSEHCKVCSHPRAFEIMTQVYQGNMTYVEASQELGLPQPTVWNCFSKHWQVTHSEEGLALEIKKAETTDDFIQILKKNIRLFLDRLNDAQLLPVTSMNERAVTMLSKELRGLMRDILEFEGKIKTGTFVQLNILQVQMTKLTSWLLTELCEDDKEKLLQALPKIMQEAPVVAQT